MSYKVYHFLEFWVFESSKRLDNRNIILRTGQIHNILNLTYLVSRNEPFNHCILKKCIWVRDHSFRLRLLNKVGIKRWLVGGGQYCHYSSCFASLHVSRKAWIETIVLSPVTVDTLYFYEFVRIKTRILPQTAWYFMMWWQSVVTLGTRSFVGPFFLKKRPELVRYKFEKWQSLHADNTRLMNDPIHLLCWLKKLINIMTFSSTSQ